MDRKEAARIVTKLIKRGEYITPSLEFNEEGQLIVDGHFTLKELEAIVFMLKVCPEVFLEGEMNEATVIIEDGDKG